MTDWLIPYTRVLEVTAKDEARFWSKVDRTGECWLWRGYLAKGGYGQFNMNRQPVPAHRVAYTITTGPIPPGLELDHLCRVRSCVRPDHLEAVTRRINQFRKRGTHCPNGHLYEPSNILIDSNNSRRCVVCYRAKERRAYLTERARLAESRAAAKP